MRMPKPIRLRQSFPIPGPSGTPVFLTIAGCGGDPVSYCTPKVNSVGCLPAVAFTGTAFLSQSVTWLYVYLIIGALSGLAAPAINSVLSREVADNMQGELQGAVNAANSLATIIGPLAATQIFSYFTYAADSPGYFPGAPFIAAGIVIAGAAALYVYVAFRFDLRHRPSIAEHPVVPDMAPPGQINIPSPEEDRDNNGNGDDGSPPRN